MKTLVIGAHGNVALRLLPLLTEAGHDVVGTIRDPKQSVEIEETGATPVVFDIEHADRDAWVSLIGDADAVIWSAGAGGGAASRTYRIDRDAAIMSINAAQQLGTNRYLMVSYFGASLDHGIPEDDDFYAYAQSKAEADEHLRTSELGNFTILAPSTLTNEAGTGKIAIAEAEDAKPQQVSRDTVARVIAATLTREDLAGATVRFDDGDTPVDEALEAFARTQH